MHNEVQRISQSFDLYSQKNGESFHKTLYLKSGKYFRIRTYLRIWAASSTVQWFRRHGNAAVVMGLKRDCM